MAIFNDTFLKKSTDISFTRLLFFTQAVYWFVCKQQHYKIKEVVRHTHRVDIATPLLDLIFKNKICFL